MRMFVKDIGTTLLLTTNMTLTDATELKLVYAKPNGGTGEWDASIDLSDAKALFYVTKQNDIDQIGLWYLQAKITFENGLYYSTKVELYVMNTID